MRLTSILLVSIGLSVLAAAPALCGPIQGRLDMQRARISQGVRNGNLTRGEAMRLRFRERRIAAERAAFVSNDGRLGPRERFILHRQLNRQSQRIYRLRRESCRS